MHFALVIASAPDSVGDAWISHSQLYHELQNGIFAAGSRRRGGRVL